MNLAEIVNVVREEHKTYPMAAFLSDTGGAAGLFLGLNIIGLFVKVKSNTANYIFRYVKVDNKDNWMYFPEKEVHIRKARYSGLH